MVLKQPFETTERMFGARGIKTEDRTEREEGGNTDLVLEFNYFYFVITNEEKRHFTDPSMNIHLKVKN